MLGLQAAQMEDAGSSRKGELCVARSNWRSQAGERSGLDKGNRTF